MLDIDEIVMHLSIDLLGIIVDDEHVIKASNNGEPIVLDPNSKASLAYRNIARRLLGESVPLMSLDDEEQKGFFSKIKSYLARVSTSVWRCFFIHIFSISPYI